MKLSTSLSLLGLLQAADAAAVTQPHLLRDNAKRAVTGPLTSVVGTGDNFWVMQCNADPVTTQRLDPVVSPGKISGHTHSIWGGNGFADTLSYAQTQTSTCNTCQVASDHSNYWVPSLYFRDPKTGSFELVKNSEKNNGAMKIYYLNRGNRGPSNPTPDNPDMLPEKVHPFPLGFRMISGSSDADGQPVDVPLGGNPNGGGGGGTLQWNCANQATTYGHFPTGGYCHGMTAAVHFPNCWDGVRNDSTSHKDHVAWPVQNGQIQPENGDCPESHPYRTMTIFMEIAWYTEEFDSRWSGKPEDWPFVLSNGDRSGYALHADFVNGWEPDVLQGAIDYCHIGNDGGKEGNSACFAMQTDEQYQNCKSTVYVEENVDGRSTPLFSLPGNNPIRGHYANSTNFDAPQGAPSGTPVLNHAPVIAGDDSGELPLADGYPASYTGYRAFDLASNQALTGPPNTVFLPSLGSAKYPDLGKGADVLTGVGAMQTSGGAPVNGGTAAAPTTASAASASSVPLVGPAGASAATDSGTVTTSAAVVASSASGVGSSSATGAAGANPVTITETQDNVPVATSPMATEVTNAGVTTALVAGHVAPSASPSPPTTAGSGPAKYIGCYVDPVDPLRALSGVEHVTIGNHDVTASACAAWCSSHSYPISGTENGGECYCGAALPTFGTLAESLCDMPCEGDASQTCGGPGALSVWQS